MSGVNLKRGIGLAVWALVSVAAAGPAAAAGAAGAERGAASPDRLIAHEWGTFTSFSGPDGRLRRFETYVGPGSDLPEFVHTWNSRSGGGEAGLEAGTRQGTRVLASEKAVETALHRMETPVIYFYSGRPETVQVRASILDGKMTEFYPPVTTRGPVSDEHRNQVWWEKVRIMGGRVMDSAPSLRMENPESHYHRARATEASPVQVEAAGSVHSEKFLFYRGLADFESRVKLTALRGGKFRLVNQTGQAISAAVVVQVEGKHLRFARFGPISGQAELELPTEPAGEEALAAELRRVLEADGLYPMEAAAMVATWKTQWLGEPGTRVLYTIPRSEIDRVVPLSIEPAPAELARVFIGRLDIMTPEDVARLEDEIRRAKPTTTPGDFNWLGRFRRPALEFIRDKSADEQVKRWVDSMTGR